MPKLLDLFGEKQLSGRELITSSPKSLNDLAVSGVVSPTGVQLALEIMSRVSPKVDYSDFKNFVFFNSALDYFNITGDRMIAEYPFDGNFDDALSFRSASDPYENFVIGAWPRWSGSGHFTSGVFAIVGDSSVVSSAGALLAMSSGTSGALNVPLTLEYRLVFPSGAAFPVSGSASVLAQHFNASGTSPNWANSNYAVFLSSDTSGTETVNFFLRGATFSASQFGTNAPENPAVASFPIPSASQAGVGYYMAWVLDPASGTLSFYKTVSGSYAFPFTDIVVFTSASTGAAAKWSFTTGSTAFSTGSNVFVMGNHPSATLPLGKAPRAPDFQLSEFRYWIAARDSAHIFQTYNNRVFKGNTLQAYWRFAEPYTSPGPNLSSIMALRDYSGHKMDARVVGSSVSAFWVHAAAGNSGTRPGGLGMPQDAGEPLLSPRAADVQAFVAREQVSGSLYDRNNPNLITNFVPQQYLFLEDEQNTAVMKNLLFLLGRQFDELKVFIDQTTHILTADYTEFDTTPDALLDEALSFWGWSTKGNFLSKEAFQWFFGLNVLGRTPQDVQQGVFSNERLDTELFKIKNEFWRRTLNNLAYLYKTKGTRESVEALFRIYGLDQSVVKLKEYGLKPFVSIQTNRINSLKSHDVLKIDGHNLGVYGVKSPQTIPVFAGAFGSVYTVDMQVAFPAFNSTIMPTNNASGSSGSIFHLTQAGGGALARSMAFPLGAAGSSGTTSYDHLYYVREWRSGTLTQNGKLIFQTSSGSAITFDNLPIFDGRWYHLSLERNANQVRLDVQFLDTDQVGAKGASNAPLSVAVPFVASGTVPAVLKASTLALIVGFHPDAAFAGGQFWTHNVQVWSQPLTDIERADHTVNPFSHGAETPDKHLFLELDWRFDELIDSDQLPSPVYLDSINGINGTLIGSGTSITGTWSSNTYDRFNFSYNFIAPPDFAWNEEKIRFIDNPRPTVQDHWNEIDDVGIEFNLIDALNEDISFMLASMDNWNNVIGDPANRYRENYPQLEKLRQQYFTKMSGRINFRVFIDYLDFFDRSFIELVKRLLPARVDFQGAEIVVESHMLERPKAQFPYRRTNPQLVPEGVITIYAYPPTPSRIAGKLPGFPYSWPIELA